MENYIPGYGHAIIQAMFSFDGDDGYLDHSGVAHDENPPGRGSGRYGWGSGEKPHQRDWDLAARIEKYKANGMTDSEIAKVLGYTYIDSKTGEVKGNTKTLRAVKQIANENIRGDKHVMVLDKINELYPNGEKPNISRIAKEFGVNESSVREAVKDISELRANRTKVAADRLKAAVAEKGFIDVGRGVNLDLGLTADSMDVALKRLEEEGYVVQNVSITQPGSRSGFRTTIRVLAPPGTESNDIYQNRYNIQTFTDIQKNESIETMTALGINKPESITSDRVFVRYKEDGGTERDGMIELRAIRDENGNLKPACEDLSLGEAKYGQVRIAVDGTHYIKGMAVYSDRVPEGYDICVNSNKSVEKGIYGSLKELKLDDDNPFGASVVQTRYLDSKTGQMKLSPVNVVGYPTPSNNDAHLEGLWGTWSKTLPAQFLSKQSLSLTKQQLLLAKEEKEKEYNDILALTNPVIKKKMLIDFADGCDAAAADLKAAALPDQKTHVILSVPSLKDSECYAPNYRTGTQLALVRFPHTGAWEIPILTVNNNNSEANGFMKDAKDAIGINYNNASILSGADFDGDTVIAIPLTRYDARGELVRVNTIKGSDKISIPELKNFDPGIYSSENFPKLVDKNGNPTYHLMNKKERGLEMGKVSNLITDMSLMGCDDTKEIARAVKYSMVVIDAYKHKLNYKQAYIDYGIKDITNKYQNKPDGHHGASTLLSQAKSPTDIPQRSLRTGIDENTGEKIFYLNKNRFKEETVKRRVKNPETGRYLKDENGKFIYETKQGKLVKNGTDEKGRTLYSYDAGEKPGSKTNNYIWEKTGKIKEATTTVNKMSLYSDASALLSANPNQHELAYRDYANAMKALANRARLDYIHTPHMETTPEAKGRYKGEIESLKEKLRVAQSNAPLERRATMIANSRYHAKLEDNPDMSDEDKKRLKGQCLQAARMETGAHKTRVTFTEREWEAVQNGAVSESFFRQLLDNADKDNYTKLATPRKEKTFPESRVASIKALYATGRYTQEQLAEEFGYSQSMISTIISK